MKYNKFDLMWEATRRNEDYRAQYLSFLEKYQQEFNDRGNDTPDYLPYPQSGRWNINIIREEQGRIKVLGWWVNPGIEIDVIKGEILSGADPLSVHPYAYMDQLTRTNPNIYYHQLKEKTGGEYFSEQDIDGDIYVCIKKSIIRNRMLALIDPMSEDKTIMMNIQKIKNKVLNDIKKQMPWLKEINRKIFYPRDIHKYIGWLNKYDEIVDHLRQETEDGKLIIRNGVVIVPGSSTFREMLAKKGTIIGPKFESQRKAYKDAYNGAVQLIRDTPEIIFSPSRTQSSSKN